MLALSPTALLVKEDFVLMTAITRLHQRKGVIERPRRQGIDSSANRRRLHNERCEWKRPWIAYCSYFYADLSVVGH